MTPEKQLLAIFNAQCDNHFDKWMPARCMLEVDECSIDMLRSTMTNFNVLNMLLDPQGLCCIFGDQWQDAAHDILQSWLDGGDNAAIKYYYEHIVSGTEILEMWRKDKPDEKHDPSLSVTHE